MEKETLLTGFKKVLGDPSANGYLGDTGVTMRTLDKFVDALLPTITSDEMVNDNFYQLQSGVIKAMGGQMRFEQAEFVRNYKPDGGEPQVNPQPETQPTVKNSESELLKRLENLEKEIEDSRKNSAVQELRSEVLRKSGELKVSNKNLWEDSVRMVEYKEGMDSASMLSKAKDIYESKLKSYFGDGASPYGAIASTVPPKDDKTLDNFFAKKTLEGKFPGKK